jgi:hypothetical protein
MVTVSNRADLLILQYPMWWHLPPAMLKGEDWTRALDAIDERSPIPSNRMAEWGPDGRIKPGAPVHSPFVRRRKKLELE